MPWKCYLYSLEIAVTQNRHIDGQLLRQWKQPKFYLSVILVGCFDLITLSDIISLPNLRLFFGNFIEFNAGMAGSALRRLMAEYKRMVYFCSLFLNFKVSINILFLLFFFRRINIKPSRRNCCWPCKWRKLLWMGSTYCVIIHTPFYISDSLSTYSSFITNTKLFKKISTISTKVKTIYW